LKQENLKNDLQEKLDISDFNIYLNKNDDTKSYIITNYFNDDSINLINQFYEQDFAMFNYDIVKIDLSI
jgi:hypothetical protein